jgi:TPR repeat protein
MSKAVESKKQRQARALEIYARGQKQQEKGNLKSGFRLLLAAAKLGDPGAQLNLGYTYDVGVVVRRNRAAAMHWYKKAYRSQHGWGIAASNIGTIFRDEHNYPEAIRWFRRGVRYGDVDANLDLARIYLKNPKWQDRAVACLKAILKATPPIGVGEDTQREARKLLRRIEKGSSRGDR